MNSCLLTFLFSLSLVFQLSGAILLILNYFSKTKKKIAYEYFTFEGYVIKVDKEMKKIRMVDENRLSDILHGIYLNRVAFIYLLIGYAVTVIGENKSSSPCILALILIAISVIFSVITFKIIEKIARRRSSLPKYTIIGQEDMAIGALVVEVIKEDSDK